MTIQEIIDNRVADIIDTILICPESASLHSVNMEFLAWLKNKFDHEHETARRKLFRGEIKTWEIKSPTRVTKLDRPNYHRWAYPGVK